MDSLSFCYWLQGVFEVTNPKTLNAEQTQMIKDHLKLVFNKVTPNPITQPLDGPWKPVEPLRPNPFQPPYPWQPYPTVTCAANNSSPPITFCFSSHVSSNTLGGVYKK